MKLYKTRTVNDFLIILTVLEYLKKNEKCTQYLFYYGKIFIILSGINILYFWHTSTNATLSCLYNVENIKLFLNNIVYTTQNNFKVYYSFMI